MARGQFYGLKHATGAAIGKLAIKTYVCRGCGLQHSGDKPEVCKACGRLDFTKFDSRYEAQRWGELELKRKVGLISDLRTQVWFDLMAPGPNGMAAKVASYVADFVYLRDGVEIVEDAKGAITDVAKLKLKWMAAMGRPVTIVTKAGHNNGF